MRENSSKLRIKSASSQALLTNDKLQIVLLLIVLAHVFALSKLMFFPYPELFVYPYLTNSGLLPYKQIFDQHFPGLLFLPLNFEVLGLTNEYIARWWQYGLVVITQVLLFFISKTFFKSSIKALAVCFLYLLWQPFFQGWVLWINNFLTIFYLVAFYFAYLSFKNGSRVFHYIFLAGFFLGIATIFKQVAIPLAALVLLYLLYFNRTLKTLIFFASGFLVPIVSMLGYLMSIGVLKEFWFWTVQFNLTTYAKLGGSVPEAVAVKRIVGVSLPALLSFFHSDKKNVFLVGIFFVGSFLAGGNNFDFTYFQPALPYICIATIYGFDWIRQNELPRSKLRGILAASSLLASSSKQASEVLRVTNKIGWLLISLYIVVSLRWLIPFYQSHMQSFVYYFDNETKNVARTVKEHTKPGEEIFVYGVTPLIYQMSETLPAGKVFVYQFPWFLTDAGDRIYQGLNESKPRIVVSDPTVQTKGQRITDFAPELNDYIYSHYQLKVKIGTIEILERID